jgi:hypothetical protein
VFDILFDDLIQIECLLNTYKKVEDETHLKRMLDDTLLTEYIKFDYDQKQLESQYNYFKNFHYKNVAYYSYSCESINKFLNRNVLDKNCRMSAYTINLIINLIQKPNLLNYFEGLC